MLDLSRRRFINLVGRAGGIGAVYRTMAAMGLLAVPEAYAGPPALPAGSGRGVHVLILGAGLAGLTSAYELRKAGYACTVLEARGRPGGRCWTLRGGDVIDETDSTQRLTWDAGDHMYCNAGPSRIPFHHEAILAYCRELEVPLEVMINDDGGGLVQDDAVNGGKPQRARDVVDGARSVVSELAARALDRGALAAPLGAEDGERFRAFLQQYGGLDINLARVAPGFDVHMLLRPSFWRGPMVMGGPTEHAPTMLQPVGGMARIAQAFAKALGPLITYNAQVTQLRKSGAGARVIWVDRRTGAAQAVEASYVICTLPIPTLRRIETDLTPKVRAALGEVRCVPAVRLAFQADRRFWELDDQIFGGISWTTREISQIWYPSHGIHQKKGILLGGYLGSTAAAEELAKKTPAERLAVAVASGERLHPGYAREVSRGASVAWSKIPFSEGAWVEWSNETRKQHAMLAKPDGAIHFAGEHLSSLGGWQEGAVRSAHGVVYDVAARVRAKKT